MLPQWTEVFDVRLDGRSIELEHLDITSCLSAPNRFNSCNKHEGAMYRIFTALIDMGWQRKLTASCNLAIHILDKIVEPPDPEKGQIHKFEQDKLKIQMVIDWSVSAGLLVHKEYKYFCKWGKHLNTDHTEVAAKIRRSNVTNNLLSN
jgi:hypothetical protein